MKRWLIFRTLPQTTASADSVSTASLSSVFDFHFYSSSLTRSYLFIQYFYSLHIYCKEFSLFVETSAHILSIILAFPSYIFSPARDGLNLWPLLRDSLALHLPYSHPVFPNLLTSSCFPVLFYFTSHRCAASPPLPLSHGGNK